MSSEGIFIRLPETYKLLTSIEVAFHLGRSGEEIDNGSDFSRLEYTAIVMPTQKEKHIKNEQIERTAPVMFPI